MRLAIPDITEVAQGRADRRRDPGCRGAPELSFQSAAGAHNGDHGKGAQPFQDGVDVLLPAHRRKIPTMKIRRLSKNFHGRPMLRTTFGPWP